MSSRLVLVTGVTGFIAAHVAEQLLQTGYRVRGTARTSKIALLNESCKTPGLEYVGIDDIATSDFTEALKGVHAVVHVASPLPGKASAEDLTKTAISGSLNIPRQAEKVGIAKFVVTGTFGAVVDADMRSAFAGTTISESDWSPTSQEEVSANEGSSPFVYFATKALAEKAVWDFALLPGFVFGPYSKLLPVPANVSELGTNSFVWALFNGASPPPAPPFVVDVRDVAKAHVLALSLKPVGPDGSVEDKRFLINAGNYTWKEAAEYLRREKPECRNVLEVNAVAHLPGPHSRLDTSRAAKALGLKAEDYIRPEQTIVDTIDALIELSKTW